MSSLRGDAAALAAAVGVGTSGVAVKLALDQGVPPLVFIAAALLLAAAVLLPWLPRFPRPAAQDRWRFLGGIVAGNCVAPAAIAYGLAHASVVTASLLVNLELVFTAVLAYVFLHERTGRHESLGLVLLALGGLVVSVGAPLVAGAPDGGSSFLGVALVALGTLAYAVDNTLSTPLTRRYALMPMMAGRVLAGALAVTAVAALVHGGAVPARGALGYVAWHAVFGIAASVFLFYVALRQVGATRTVVLFSTTALWGALAAVLVLDEVLVWPHFVGAVLMTLGVAALAWSARIRPFSA